VAISNIPFGDYKPFDPRLRVGTLSSTTISSPKTLDKVRPGGMILFITSKGTMDKVDGACASMSSTMPILLGAIRLPNDAFKKNANTEVTTDIVVLRKRLPASCRPRSGVEGSRCNHQLAATSSP
jgi:hypothetical protein